MQHHHAFPVLLAGLLATALPAVANDTTANIAAGGLVFEKTDAIEMQSEDLSISTEEVKVVYSFRNTTAADVTTTVAFPMPDVTFQPFEIVHIPSEDPNNPFDFTTTVDGKPVDMKLEQTVRANDKDVTATMDQLKLPRSREDGGKALEALPEATRQQVIDAGIAIPEEYDDGNGGGTKIHVSPGWTLRNAYHWQQTFPAGKTISIVHRYKPSVGGSVGTALGSSYAEPPEIAELRKKYCIDDDLMRTVEKKSKAAAEGSIAFNQHSVDYILVTGANWAKPIGDFRLTVDKGEAKNLVSFCGSGVKKIAPTVFEMRKKDFLPKEDLHVIILSPAE